MKVWCFLFSPDHFSIVGKASGYGVGADGVLYGNNVSAFCGVQFQNYVIIYTKPRLVSEVDAGVNIFYYLYNEDWFRMMSSCTLRVNILAEVFNVQYDGNIGGFTVEEVGGVR